MKLEPSGYEGRLTISLEPIAGGAARKLGSEPAPGDWLCQVPMGDDLELRLQDVELAVGDVRFLDPTARLEPSAPAILILGGTRKAELGLEPVLEPQGGTTVSVLDPRTGEVAETGRGLALKLPQERMLVPVGERLVVLEREPADPEAGALLAPNLMVVAPSFFRGDLALREESFLRGGQVRFPGGEKEQVVLARDFLLRIPERTELRLKSLRAVGEELEMVLWGKPTSLELGPTRELMNELLPSVFVWLSTHRLPLVFSVLGALLTAVVGLLRLIGLVGKEE